MKQVVLLLLSTLFWCAVQSQSANTDPGRTGPQFFVGISYLYSSFETDLTSLSYHSIWYDQDLGTITLNDSELDELNDQTKESNYLNQLVVEPGMVFLNKSKWYFEGSLLLGISRVKYKTTVDQPDDNHKEVTSGFKNPVGGLSLNLRYNFSDRWGLTLIPQFKYTWGNADKIVDSIQPYISYFENHLKEDYSLGYGRIDLMASFKTEKIIISVGPGAHYSFVNKSFTIDRTDPETMEQYHDQIKSSLSTFAYIDGCVRADWTIIDPLILSAEAALGKDLYIKAGLRYNF